MATQLDPAESDMQTVHPTDGLFASDNNDAIAQIAVLPAWTLAGVEMDQAWLLLPPAMPAA